jgi:hypothetical protein
MILRRDKRIGQILLAFESKHAGDKSDFLEKVHHLICRLHFAMLFIVTHIHDTLISVEESRSFLDHHLEYTTREGGNILYKNDIENQHIARGW